MDLSLHLPLWAIFYCGFIFANAVMTIILSQNRDVLYMTSQMLSAAFAISFFFIYYGAIKKPDETILVLMLLYIIFHEIWVNRKLYDRFIFDNIPENEKDIAMISIIVTLLIFLSPLFYVLVNLFNF